MQETLGEKLINYEIFTGLKSSEIISRLSINGNFIPDNPVNFETYTVLYKDPFYGLDNMLNYDHWNNLLYTVDPLKQKKKLSWMWELRTYFGLNFA